jgi:hypothetical protein
MIRLIIFIIGILLIAYSIRTNLKPRTWTNIRGNQFEAQFSSRDKGIITLKLNSGKVIRYNEGDLPKEINPYYRIDVFVCFFLGGIVMWLPMMSLSSAGGRGMHGNGCGGGCGGCGGGG